METLSLNQQLRTIQIGSADPVQLRAKSFKVLEILAESAPNPVDKNTIIDVAWEGRAVSDDSLVQCIADIRRALGALGHEILQTLPSLGYRLMSRNRIQDSETVTPVRKGLRIDLFEDLSTDKAGASLAYGLFTDLVHFLTKARIFRVINSQEIHRDSHQSEYSLSGSVQYQGDVIRIVTILNELSSGEVIWTQRWNGVAGNYFELQDKIVTAIVNEIGGTWSGRVAQHHSNAASSHQTHDLDAYSHLQSGVVATTTFSDEGLRSAIDHFQKATEIDPNYGVAWACQSIVYAIMTTTTVGDELRALLDARYQTARTAFACAPLNSWSLLVGGWAEARDRNFDLAKQLINQAVEEEPNNSDILVTAAHMGIFNTDMLSEPIIWAERAFELNVNRPVFYYWPLGYSYALNGNYPKALAALSMGPQNYPELLAFKAGLESVLGLSGALEETRASLLELVPEYSIQEYLLTEPWGSSAKEMHVRQLLEAAALPA